jgi:FSR family fosmidomycin resistance protein-like MFS transporter
MVGALAAGALSDRWGRRLILFISMATTTPLMLAFLASHGLERVPILLALGFSALAVIPVLMALLQESFPENRALANGLYLGLNFLIQAGATIVIGALGDRFGLRIAFTACALAPLPGLPLILLLPGTRSQRGGAVPGACP